MIEIFLGALVGFLMGLLWTGIRGPFSWKTMRELGPQDGLRVVTFRSCWTRFRVGADAMFSAPTDSFIDPTSASIPIHDYSNFLSRKLGSSPCYSLQKSSECLSGNTGTVTDRSRPSEKLDVAVKFLGN